MAESMAQLTAQIGTARTRMDDLKRAIVNEITQAIGPWMKDYVQNIAGTQHQVTTTLRVQEKLTNLKRNVRRIADDVTAGLPKALLAPGMWPHEDGRESEIVNSGTILVDRIWKALHAATLPFEKEMMAAGYKGDHRPPLPKAAEDKIGDYWRVAKEVPTLEKQIADHAEKQRQEQARREWDEA